MITEIKNKVFRSATVNVEGKRFVDCQFLDCILTYQGGKYGGWERTTFNGCSWKFDGCALETVRLLYALKLLPIPISEHGVSMPN